MPGKSPLEQGVLFKKRGPCGPLCYFCLSSLLLVLGGRSLPSVISPQQCYYTIRIFAGQDPSCVWVGWVTPDYHLYSEKFDLNKNCTVTVTLGDERGRVHER